MLHHIAGFSEALGGWALSPAQDNVAAGSGVTANVCLGWWALPYALELGRVVVTSWYHLYYCLLLGSVDGSDAVASELKFNCLNMNLTI
jgi:hypothetical protein